MTLNQGYLSKFKVSERKVNYLSPIYTFLIEKHCKEIAFDLRLCHFVEYASKQLKSADRIQTKDLMKSTSIRRKTFSLHGFETSCSHHHSLEREIPVSFVKPPLRKKCETFKIRKRP